MFLRHFDLLSPPITLYFRGQKKHHSIFSGVLTIISYIIILVFGVYYTLEFINRENPSAYFFNKYVDDAGDFPVNASSMFHFIQLFDTVSNEPIPMDFQAFRILGFDEVYANTYITDDDGSTPKQRNPTEFNHWLYGPCNNSSDTKGISYLINFKYFEQSACIRKYYDKISRKYYDTFDPNFKWPIIQRGCSNPNRTFYGIIMEKCRNDDAHILSGYKICKTDSEINNIINKNTIILQLIDQYADTLNYEMPFKQFFNAITTTLALDNYGVNNINLNPAIIITHNGLLFDNIVETPSYFFTQNDKQTILTDHLSNVNTYNCLLGFYFWMQNNMQYYERIYKRIQDILSDIGGINSIVIVAAQIINFFVRGYIILLDTENLYLNIEKENFQRSLNRKTSRYKKVNSFLFPPKRIYKHYGYQNNQQQLSNYQRLMKDGVDVYLHSNSKDDYSEKNKNIYLKRRNINMPNNYKKYFEGKAKNNEQMNQGGYKDKEDIKSSNNNLKTLNVQSNNNKILILDNNDINKVVIPKGKQNFSYCDYIKYIIYCKKNNPKISYYENFRREIISEENLLQYHLDIYELLKFCNLEKKNISNRKSF